MKVERDQLKHDIMNGLIPIIEKINKLYGNFISAKKSNQVVEKSNKVKNELEEFKQFCIPILVGTSRKSMIYKLLDNSPEQALNGTSITNTIALQKGATILRVHDVKEAIECIKITTFAENNC